MSRTGAQFRVVGAVPSMGLRAGPVFLKALGAPEVGLAPWLLSGIAPLPWALAHTLLLAVPLLWRP